MVIECDAHAFFAAEHLTGHESVEDSCADQRETEIEAKQPPVLRFLVELGKKQNKGTGKNTCLFFKIMSC